VLAQRRIVSTRSPGRTLRQRVIHEAAQRRRLAIVLPLLLARAAGHVAISALGRQLRLCGVSPSEKYLAQLLTARWGAIRGRLRHKVTRRRAVVWHGLVLRPGGVERARCALAVEYESALVEAGLAPEPVAAPSWRQLSEQDIRELTSGCAARVLVRLPADEDDREHQSVEVRARNFLCDAMAAGPYNHALEELLWRGDWGGYPRWHRQLLAGHLEGQVLRTWAARHGVGSTTAKGVLQLHRARAGLRPGD
jgi:hypothetical protein